MTAPTPIAHDVADITESHIISMLDTALLPGLLPAGRRYAGLREQMEVPVPVEAGTAAPDFTLTSDSGEAVTLSSLRGAPVVLYFYPRDDTPGCTTQACGIRDSWGEFERKGVVVLGVSPDGEESHAAFRDKLRLPFPLLADTGHAVAEAYGVWVERSRDGKTFMGIERSTFVIAPDGTVLEVMRKVSPESHAADVLAALP